MEKFKCIKGSVSCGKPATIMFMDDVDDWSVSNFISDLNFLTTYVKPSKITIMINSTGGNVVDGLSAFSAIQSCPIDTVCVNEGIAASMGSIIWAAGKECKMKDYALLMLHNPYAEAEDEETKRYVGLCVEQLKTIYCKRFKMSEEDVKKFMDGEGNYDGTFFTAERAVEAGFLAQEDVIETGPVKAKVAASLRGMKNITADLMSSAVFAATNQQNNKSREKMNEQVKVFAALLGMAGDNVDESKVKAEILALVKSRSEYKAVQDKVKEQETAMAALRTELEGSKAAVGNLQKNLDEAQAKVKAFEEAEAKAAQAAAEAMVDAAIEQSKIGKETRDTWLAMAKENMELVKTTLAAIPAREDLGKAIAGDPANHAAAQQGMQSAEAAIEAKVLAVVGSDFKPRSL